MKLVFADEAWDDLQHWILHDKAALKKLLRLIGECRRASFEGIGKPEPLRGNLSGWWSRRITGEHRLVYRITGEGADQALEIAQCRGHY
jgi:toxin YoeB